MVDSLSPVNEDSWLGMFQTISMVATEVRSQEISAMQISVQWPNMLNTVFRIFQNHKQTHASVHGKLQYMFPVGLLLPEYMMIRFLSKRNNQFPEHLFAIYSTFYYSFKTCMHLPDPPSIFCEICIQRWLPMSSFPDESMSIWYLLLSKLGTEVNKLDHFDILLSCK